MCDVVVVVSVMFAICDLREMCDDLRIATATGGTQMHVQIVDPSDKIEYRVSCRDH